MVADKSTKMLSPKQIARKLGLCTRQIYRLLHYQQNPIPHHKIGKVYRIREDEFDKWLESTRK